MKIEFNDEVLNFLSKIEMMGRDPWATMASDALLWKEEAMVLRLAEEFPQLVPKSLKALLDSPWYKVVKTSKQQDKEID